MLTVRRSEAEIFNISKLRWDTHGLGRWTTDSQVYKWTIGDYQRTGMYQQSRTTTDHSACSVTGVLQTLRVDTTLQTKVEG